MSNLREEFEKLPEIADRLKEYEHLFKLSSNNYICECSYVENFLNGAWYAFEDRQKKIDDTRKEINNLFDNQTMTPSPREYANKLSEVLEVLK